MVLIKLRHQIIRDALVLASEEIKHLVGGERPRPVLIQLLEHFPLPWEFGGGLLGRIPPQLRLEHFKLLAINLQIRRKMLSVIR